MDWGSLFNGVCETDFWKIPQNLEGGAFQVRFWMAGVNEMGVWSRPRHIPQGIKHLFKRAAEIFPPMGGD